MKPGTKILSPYLLFLGDIDDPSDAKLASGVVYWRPQMCAGQFRLPGCRADLGIAELSLADAKAMGVRSFVIGTATRGGTIPDAWRTTIIRALETGFDLVSGLHERLSRDPELHDVAARSGVRLIELRDAPRDYPVATGARRSGRRLLTVGTDCAVGKMFTALAIERELQQRGMAATFRATGQIGILISGGGVPLDAVISDFNAGAIETLSPPAPDDHWDIIEGQASVLNPSYGGVTLSLVHGSQPDAMVLCHEAGRLHLDGLPDYPMQSLKVYAEAHEQAARLTNPKARVIAVSLNTRQLAETDARLACELAEAELGVPCTDPVRYGVEPIADILQRW
jgi:uncharacterized NAD-dependent epimerase/dehydratase family protein